ncbi:hypothetical protein GVN21_10395 [Caulobacter sp. SLTY]|uniref:hypothetical protein n=1 Tax=Caulobacter sp. SLTY TaxID=2683262 RepID=UPI001412D0AC|nr:hypothetical protein [Caulobacter sp. SLTY]NBB15764.1 hypothetical protein [Caulobacter sp. SLTY]
MSLLLPALLLALAAEPANVSPVDVRKPVGQTSVRMPVGKIGVNDLDRISCKREAVVGSRRQRKICDTTAGWQRRADEAAMAMDPGRRTSGRDN